MGHTTTFSRRSFMPKAALSSLGSVLGSSLVVTMFALSASNSARAATNTALGFQQSEKSESVSQLIRSNTAHYWKTMKATAPRGPLGPYVGFTGVVAGDPHLGNFSVVPAKTVGGEERLRYLAIDFDDAGRGSFALDYTRLMVAVKAISDDVKARDLTEAYLLGLNGGMMAPPSSVAKLLRGSMASYRALTDEYVNDKSTESDFIYKAGKIERYRGPIAKSDIARLFPSHTVLSIALRPRERGGSKDALRLWVLARNDDGKRQIFELKGYQETGLAQYQKQPSTAEWLTEVRAAFWPGIDSSSYDLVELASAGLVWLREKKVSLIDIPYSANDADELEFISELAVFDAYLLGQVHGRQSEAKNYLTLIELDTEGFHDAVKSVAKAYLKEAADAYGDE